MNKSFVKAVDIARLSFFDGVDRARHSLVESLGRWSGDDEDKRKVAIAGNELMHYAYNTAYESAREATDKLRASAQENDRASRSQDNSSEATEAPSAVAGDRMDHVHTSTSAGAEPGEKYKIISLGEIRHINRVSTLYLDTYKGRHFISGDTYDHFAPFGPMDIQDALSKGTLTLFSSPASVDRSYFDWLTQGRYSKFVEYWENNGL